MHKTGSLLWEEREGETIFPILFSKQAFVWNLLLQNFFWAVLKLLWNLTSRIKSGTKIRRTTSPSPFWNRNCWTWRCDWGLTFNTIENAKKKKIFSTGTINCIQNKQYVRPKTFITFIFQSAATKNILANYNQFQFRYPFLSASLNIMSEALCF